MRVDLGGQAVVRHLQIQFQGGFAGRECELRVAGSSGGEEERQIMEFHPSDSNCLQVSNEELCYNHSIHLDIQSHNLMQMYTCIYTHSTRHNTYMHAHTKSQTYEHTQQ